MIDGSIKFIAIFKISYVFNEIIGLRCFNFIILACFYKKFTRL
jgi:hypothetical protein